VDAEVCWSVISDMLASIRIMGFLMPEKNSFGTIFDNNNKAEARLSCYWEVCGYTEDVHRFIFQNNDFGSQMRTILAQAGHISFGTEKKPMNRKLIVQTAGPTKSKVPFLALRAWYAAFGVPAPRVMPSADPPGAVPTAVLAAAHPAPLMLPPADPPGAVPAAVLAAAHPVARVNKQRYNKGTLVGNDVAAFLERWPAMMGDFIGIYKTGYRPPHQTVAQFNSDIEEFVRVVNALIDGGIPQNHEPERSPVR
jgi:hypothetical protein